MDTDKFIQYVSVAVILVSVVLGGIIVYNILKIPANPKVDSNTNSATDSLPAPQASDDLGPITQQVLREESAKPKQATPAIVDASKVKTASNPFIGRKEAPLTILYWFDYQCPFCKKMEQNIITQLITDHIEPGKAKLVYKDYQFLGTDSQTAGLAARAVWEIAPGRFFEWHKAMYENQDGENYAWGSKADILILTKSLGIDSARVGKLMTDKAAIYQSAMNADKAEGKALGIKGTPGTVIGTKLIIGAQPYAVFKSAVDQALEGR